MCVHVSGRVDDQCTLGLGLDNLLGEKEMGRLISGSV